MAVAVYSQRRVALEIVLTSELINYILHMPTIDISYVYGEAGTQKTCALIYVQLGVHYLDTGSFEFSFNTLEAPVSP